MAQLQTESIDHCRRLGQSGAWWWDFHCACGSQRLLSFQPLTDLFSSHLQLLCVLSGALDVKSDDRTMTLPDMTKNKEAIRRVLRNIHEMTHRGRPKVAQSTRFLRILLRTMEKRGSEVSRLFFCLVFLWTNCRPDSSFRSLRNRQSSPANGGVGPSIHAS